MNWTLLRCLPGLLLVSFSFSANTATINFDSLSVEQGFNFRSDVQESVGFLTGLTFNARVFTPDMSVASPAGTNISVVGVLSSIDWASGFGDPIVLHAMVSTSSKQTVSMIAHQGLTTAGASFNFQVYDYDPLAHTYFEAFYPSQNQPLNGLVEKQGASYLYSIATSPGTDVLNPQNWELTISILPAPILQHLTFGTDSTHSFVKQYGAGSPNAPAISGVGTTNLSYHSATLRATVNPGYAPTGANFHYGLSPSLSSYQATLVNALGNGGSDAAFSSPVSNLLASATYYYQVIATNSVGTTASSIASFNTPAVPSPRITLANRQGNNLSLAGTNGAVNATFYVLASANLSSPKNSWVVLATNQFNASGNFNCVLTNAVSVANRAMFYQLRSPSN